jgi:hypothetical protein
MISSQKGKKPHGIFLLLERLVVVAEHHKVSLHDVLKENKFRYYVTLKLQFQLLSAQSTANDFISLTF